MIKVENTNIYNIYPAIKSIRNALKSWDRMDSNYVEYNILRCRKYEAYNHCLIGPKDMELAKRLIFRGGDERKFLRTIHVNADITTTRAHIQELSTYKIGTTMNSCSTMHSILNKDLTYDDFEHTIHSEVLSSLNRMIYKVRDMKENKDPLYQGVFSELKHMLPEGYLIMFNFDTNYEQLLSMYHKRKNHFFLDWIPINKWCESLPYFMEFYSAFNLNKTN